MFENNENNEKTSSIVENNEPKLTTDDIQARCSLCSVLVDLLDMLHNCVYTSAESKTFLMQLEVTRRVVQVGVLLCVFVFLCIGVFSSHAIGNCKMYFFFMVSYGYV